MDTITLDYPRVRLLGTPLVRCATGEHPLAPLRRNQLAGYLACRGDWVARAEIAELFWAGREPAESRRNLRRMLHDMRRDPSLPGIECRGDALRWRPETDLASFTSMCARGDWAGAVSVGTGRLLAGFEDGATDPFYDWLQSAREHQAAQWRSAVAKQRSALGRDAEARSELARLVLAHDPYDEDAIADLVDALRARGRDAEASEAHRRFAVRLERDLGVAAGACVSRALP